MEDSNGLIVETLSVSVGFPTMLKSYGQTGTIEFEETSTIDDSSNYYEIIREWTVADECGNVEIYAQTIFVTIESTVVGIDKDLCNGEDIEYDLFDSLDGDYGTEGIWSVTSGNADWTASAGTNVDDSEWEVKANDDWTNLGIR